MINTYIIHIPTSLFLSYCYWPERYEIHCVLSSIPPPRRDSSHMLKYLNNKQLKTFTIHNGNDMYLGSSNEFIMIKREE